MRPLCRPISAARRSAQATALGLLVFLLSAFAPLPLSAFPDPDSEFFVDLTGQVRGRDKMEIGRALRSACEESRVHAMLVLVNSMADYPDMPQEILAFSNKVGTSWNVGDKTTHKGLVVVFAVKDRKFGAAPTRELNIPNLSDSIRNSMQGRVVGYLKDGNVSGAMRVAASNIAEQLPAISQGTASGAINPNTRTTTTTTRRVVSPGYTRHYNHSSSGSGWLVGIIFLFVVFFMISSAFSGASHGYGQGGPGYGGGGGFFSGMLTGGLLGWMFGGHGGWGGGYYGSGYGSGYDETTTTTTTDSWSSGSSDSGGGSFDSFGGGGFDGGGSSGEW